MHRTAPTTSPHYYPAPNVNNAKIERPWLRVTFWPPSFFHSFLARAGAGTDWSVWENWAWRALSGPASLQRPLSAMCWAWPGRVSPGPCPLGGLRWEVQAQQQAPWTALQSRAFQTAVSVMMHFNLHLPESCLSPPFSLPLSLCPLILNWRGRVMPLPGPLQIPALPLRLESWCHLWFLLLPHSWQPLAESILLHESLSKLP